MIQLYGMSSPNVRKVAIALEEIGLPYATRHVQVFRGRQFDADFLALNPLGKVPVVIDETGPVAGRPIFESGAILLYLAETYAPEYLPAAGPARWDALQWLMLQVANIGPVFGQNSHFRLIAADNDYAAARLRRQAAQLYRVLEDRLAAAPWLGGEAYSIADMAAYPWARYLVRHGHKAEDFAALTAWKARIAERPAVQRADRVIADLGALDAEDQRQATRQEEDRFFGRHIPAPSAAEAGRVSAEAVR